MTPYYEDSAVTIYHGDCLEIIPELRHFDAVITDPPYNVGKNYGGHNDSMTEAQYEWWCRNVTDICVPAADNQFWVAPRYKLDIWLPLIPSAHLVVITRGASGPIRGGWIDQFEIALASGKTAKKFSDLWTDIRLKGEGYFFNEETFGHPGYTPELIMARAVSLLGGNYILDPFCGTGTTLRAVKDQGKKAVGIELNERYCEIAATRMSQEVFNL